MICPTCKKDRTWFPMCSTCIGLVNERDEFALVNGGMMVVSSLRHTIAKFAHELEDRITIAELTEMLDEAEKALFDTTANKNVAHTADCAIAINGRHDCSCGAKEPMKKKDPITVILKTYYPFISIKRRDQIDLRPQPKFCLFVGNRNITKRIIVI